MICITIVNGGNNRQCVVTALLPYLLTISSYLYCASRAIMQVYFFNITFPLVNENQFVFAHVLVIQYAQTVQFSMVSAHV